jgi:DNA-binding transcriptional LysR family regulator
MELRQLRYFIAVAEALHFGRAAETLHLSQPALSKQIQALEDSLGIQLFERTNHWVKLTIAGQQFLKTAYQILQDIEEGIYVTRQIAQGQAGRLRIGLTEATLFGLGPTLVKAFREQYPQVKLVLTSGDTEANIEALRIHQIDVGFVYLPIREPSLSVAPLEEQTYLVALPKTHQLAKQQQISLSSLANEPLIFYPRSRAPVLYASFIGHCEQAGFTPHVVQEAELGQTRLGLVAAGIGISFVLSNLQHLTATGVVYRPLAEKILTLNLAIAWRQDESSSPVVHTFLQMLKNIYASPA